MPVYPNDLTIPPFQIRRGTAVAVSDYVAAEGELIYATNTNQVFIGDGVTAHHRSIPIKSQPIQPIL